jgi:WD40 repeat protein/tRNA A-37 threonylcarbamoyl transferase component Bud32
LPNAADLSSDEFALALVAVSSGLVSPERMLTLLEARGQRSMEELLLSDGALSGPQLEQLARRTRGALEPRSRVHDTWASGVFTSQAALAETLDAPGDAHSALRCVIPMEVPGRYERRELVGEGGQARVRRAVDLHLGRDVALKEMKTSPTGAVDPSAAMRFLREARVTGQLTHPNVVPVHDLAQDDDGGVYYSMRLVRGRSLQDALREAEDLPARMDLLGHFLDLCHAIAYAHSRGVVHRDLKPGNVMVGEFGETVLLDWGLARVKGQAEPDTQRVDDSLGPMQSDVFETLAGVAVGTPAYMSPEQARGELDAVDERSDIYSLGAVLHHLLAGSPPVQAATVEEALRQVRRGELASLNEACPEAPPELVAIAGKAMQLDRADRYASARDLAAEVQAWMTGSRVLAYEYTPWELLLRFARRHKGYLAAATLILLTFLGATVATTLAWRSEHAALAREQQERREASWHLAQAYLEKALRLGGERRYAGQRIAAAASLSHNPVHPQATTHSPDFAALHPVADWDAARAAWLMLEGDRTPWLLQQRTLTAPEPLATLAVSPDGRFLVAAAKERFIRVWDLQQPQVAHQGLELDAGRPAWQVAISPDGRLLGAGSDGGVQLWALPGLEPAGVLPFEGRVWAMDFGPEGRVAAAATEHRLAIWPHRDGEPVLVVDEEPYSLSSMDFSPDGLELATAGSDGWVRVLATDDGRELRRFALGTSVDMVAYAPDGESIAALGRDGRLLCWPREGGEPRWERYDGASPSLAMAYSLDGRWLATSGGDLELRIRDPEDGALVVAQKAHPEWVQGLAFSPDGSLFTASRDATARQWKLLPRRGHASLEGHSGIVYQLVSWGERAATSGRDGSVRLWNLTDGVEQARFVGHDGQRAYTLALSPDERWLASAARDGSVAVYDLEAGAVSARFQASEKACWGLAFDHHGRLLTGCHDSRVQVWDLSAPTEPSATLLATLVDAFAYQLAVSPDGALVACTGDGSDVSLWDLASGQRRLSLKGHTEQVLALDFAADGRLASAGEDNQIRIWPAGGVGEPLLLEGHEGWLRSVRFSPDGALLVSAGDDRQVVVWDSRSGRPHLTLEVEDSVSAVDFTEDGARLLVADGDTVRAYPLDLAAHALDPQQVQSELERATGLRLRSFELEPLER